MDPLRMHVFFDATCIYASSIYATYGFFDQVRIGIFLFLVFYLLPTLADNIIETLDNKLQNLGLECERRMEVILQKYSEKLWRQAKKKVRREMEEMLRREAEEIRRREATEIRRRRREIRDQWERENLLRILLWNDVLRWWAHLNRMEETPKSEICLAIDLEPRNFWWFAGFQYFHLEWGGEVCTALSVPTHQQNLTSLLGFIGRSIPQGNCPVQLNLQNDQCPLYLSYARHGSASSNGFHYGNQCCNCFANLS